ncbi:hypothetical protein ACVPOW_12120 [Staphylococcus aureus]
MQHKVFSLIRLGDDQFVSTVAKVKEDAEDETNEDEQSTSTVSEIAI